MPAASLTLSPLTARRFLRRTHAFDAPLPDITAVLAHHGYVQIDPINVCGRMHDLILRNRIAHYREGDLTHYLHGGGEAAESKALDSAVKISPPKVPAERVAFEHHLPNARVLVAFPLAAWPYLQSAMHTWSRSAGRWSGRLTPREKILATELLAAITARGPLGSEDFDDDRTTRPLWGSSRLVKITLQKLFFHGRLLIAARSNNRRRYDLPERVLPAAVLAQSAASSTETARWLALLKLRQRRLALLTREELRVIDDLVQPVALENGPLLHCLRTDAPLLEEALSPPARRAPAGDARAEVRLLAPLDPIIYDRRVTSALWNFDYTWEAYTPSLKRVRGYYALPVLAGTEIVGHVDPKADRKQRKLVVVSRKIRRGHTLTPTLREFARWLNLR